MQSICTLPPPLPLSTASAASAGAITDSTTAAFCGTDGGSSE